MATRRPSERRNYKETDQDLNLTPMMNLIAILIPALLVSMVFVEITTLDVLAAGRSAEPPVDDAAVPLDVRVFITAEGYRVTHNVAEQPAQPKVIPLAVRQVDCRRYVHTTPPPRAVNRGATVCSDPSESLPFEVYDHEELRQALIEIKAVSPTERGITLEADDDIQYDALVDVMDTSRFYEQAGLRRPLFDHVRFGVRM